MPPLQEHSKVIQNLKNTFLSLCIEGLGNMLIFNHTRLSLNLLEMLDFNLDHCCDLGKFPPGICDISSGQKWSITNCHLLKKLPNYLGKLISLRVLRLFACLGLKQFQHIMEKLESYNFLTFHFVNA